MSKEKKYPVKLFKLAKDESNYGQSLVTEKGRVYYDIVVAQTEAEEKAAIEKGFAPDLLKVVAGTKPKKSAPKKEAEKTEE